jgi:hypothetical protein
MLSEESEYLWVCPKRGNSCRSQQQTLKIGTERTTVNDVDADGCMRLPAKCNPRVLGLCSMAMMALKPSVDLSGDGGCTMTVLRSALPSAVPASAGLYVTVHFRAFLEDGTVLHDSRAETAPLEVRVGVVPSDTVRACCSLSCCHGTAVTRT